MQLITVQLCSAAIENEHVSHKQPHNITLAFEVSILV